MLPRSNPAKYTPRTWTSMQPRQRAQHDRLAVGITVSLHHMQRTAYLRYSVRPLGATKCVCCACLDSMNPAQPAKLQPQPQSQPQPQPPRAPIATEHYASPPSLAPNKPSSMITRHDHQHAHQLARFNTVRIASNSPLSWRGRLSTSTSHHITSPRMIASIEPHSGHHVSKPRPRPRRRPRRRPKPPR